MPSRTNALYVALAAAAIADVASRALVPASVVDLSPLVVLVGYGAGFAALKAAMFAALIGQAELMRRIPSLAFTAPLLPAVITGAWTFGALTNITWLMS
jgi:hypothetical protein